MTDAPNLEHPTGVAARQAALEVLRLQIDFGADEAIGDDPIDRLAAARDPARSLMADIQAPRPATTDLPHPAPPPPSPPPPSPPTLGHPPLGPVASAELRAAGATDLAALRAALGAFEECALRDTAGSLVFADGEPDAAIVVVVEVPDADDDASGLPMSGPQGAFLDAMLGAIGLRRADLRIVTLIPWRPPGGRPPTPVEIATCRPFLAAHLRMLAPRHAIVFGATAARALGGPAGTTRQLRGSWIALAAGDPTRPIQALVMTPPAQVMTDARLKRTAWADLIAFRQALDLGVASQPRDFGPPAQNDAAIASRSTP